MEGGCTRRFFLNPGHEYSTPSEIRRRLTQLRRFLLASLPAGGFAFVCDVFYGAELVHLGLYFFPLGRYGTYRLRPVQSSTYG